jgi:MFS family permease
VGILIRIKSFRSLFVGQALATSGHQVAALALPTLAITQLHASALQVGLLGALAFVPSTLFGLFAGVVVDRLPRRALMVGADLGRAIVIGAVAIGAFQGMVGVGELYVAATVMGLLALVFDVSYQSHVPDLVEPDQLAAANSALEVNRSAATVIGPGLAGGLIQAAGIARALFVSVGALLISLGVLARGAQAPRTAPDSRANVLDDIREGLRLVLRDKRLVAISLCTATSNLGAFAFWSVGLVFAYRTLHMTPGQYGVVAAVGNLGLVGGALAAAPIARRLGVGPTLFLAEALLGASMLAAPLAAVGMASFVLAASQLVTNFQLPVYGVNQVALRQSLTPRTLQGRMNSIMRTIALSTIPIGSLAGGALASATGPVVAMVAGGLVACLAPLWLFSLLSVHSLPALPRLHIHSPEAAPA